jgi:hypothetical protein
MLYDSTAYKILRHFANNPGLHRAVTIGDLVIAINVHPGTAVHQRLTLDVEGPGKTRWKINRTPDSPPRYWMTVAEAKRAQKYLASIKRAHDEKIRQQLGVAA